MEKSLVAGFVVASGLAVTASAALITDGPGYFQDTTTGYRWMDINQFYNKTYPQMLALLPSGFAPADAAQMQTLMDDAPAGASTYLSDAAVMGVPSPTPFNRDIIWGFYGDGTHWAYKFRTDTSWTTAVAFTPSFQDLGLFAVSVPVPEPTTLVGALGFLGCLLVRRTR